MKKLIFNNPQGVTREELQSDLLLLPLWRQKKALSFRFLIDQVLCTKAYLLLKQALKQEYGIAENPEFDYLGHEKPVLRHHPDIHFNLSHCKSGVLCVVDQQNVGCDIECIEEKLDINLCHFCFSEKEIEDIMAAPSPCEQFTVWWTRKEAYLKLTGIGLVDNLPALFTPDVMERVSFETVVDASHGYVYTICYYKS
ncbi:MAG: 4'-phosphopantetheinyl transferase superfamily protein [Bacteroidales bacterium]|nr:4'-phosphopantetheinyl transferase superfamily protein [Bacteroidales bacterium]